MAKVTQTKGLVFSLLFLVLISLITPTNANWYGKRGDKVDDSLLDLLQGSIPSMVDRQLDAQMTLRAIGKLIRDYEYRQLQSSRGTGDNK